MATTQLASRGGVTSVDRPGRITSLDVVRGLLLVASVTCESVLVDRPLQLTHAPWIGVRAIDLIFPLFVTLSGCGLAFAYRNAVGWGPTVRRSVVLLAVGLVYMAFVEQTTDLSTLRVTGPLQVYAVLVLIIGVLHLWARTPRAWLAITLAVALGQGIVLLLWQAGCPTGELTQACNPSRTIDFVLFGESHVYNDATRGHDPEGIPSIVGAFVTAAAGVTAGHLALAGRRDPRRAALRLVVLVLGLAAVAAAASTALPTMKRLWTTPFALGTAALGVLVLAIGMAVLDSRAPRRLASTRSVLTWPLVAMGRNSLLVYFGSHLLILILLQHGDEQSWALTWSDRVDVWGHPTATFIAANLAFWFLLTAVLHRWKIYVRPR